MKLAVSNIAWSKEEDEAAFDLLRRFGIGRLEIAPPRLWSQPGAINRQEAENDRAQIRKAGFEVVAFQSLLFGRDDLKLFPSAASRPCFEYLCQMGRLAGWLGAQVLVFGSPRNRSIPEALAPEAAWSQAVRFFSELAPCLEASGVTLGLEPNPPAYGCNFICTAEEAARIVRAVDAPGFRLHLDAGALQLNDEPIEAVVSENIDLLAHVHASEPMLEPLSPKWTGHRRLAAALRNAGYAGVVSLEMKRPPGGIKELEASLSAFVESYS